MKILVNREFDSQIIQVVHANHVARKTVIPSAGKISNAAAYRVINIKLFDMPLQSRTELSRPKID